jgi:hypothetical protein
MHNRHKILRKVMPRAFFLVAALLLAVSPGFANPFLTIGANFSGTNLNNLPAVNAGFQFIPPDTSGAVGLTQFVEITNGTVSVYDKLGNLGSRIGLTTFWQNLGVGGLNIDPTAGTGTSDPRVVYDAVGGHWIVSTIDTPANGVNRVLIASSKTSDWTSGFNTPVAVQVSPTSLFGDFDMLGLNQNTVVIGFNNFSGNTETRTEFLTISKTDLATGNTSNIHKVEDPISTTGSGAHPAIDFNGTGLISVASSFNASSFQFGTVDANGIYTKVATTTAPAGTNNSPPPGRQPGGPNTIDTGDTRFSGNVYEQNGILYMAQQIVLNSASAIRWVSVNASTGAIISSGTLGDATHDYYYPSIEVSNGLVAIAFTRSGPNDVPSSYAITGTATTGGVITMDTADLLALMTGTGSYNLTFGGPSNRWGDYSETTVDPVDGSLWTIQEYVSGTNVWGTQITQLEAVPEPSTLGMLAVGALGLLVRRLRRG